MSTKRNTAPAPRRTKIFIWAFLALSLCFLAGSEAQEAQEAHPEAQRAQPRRTVRLWAEVRDEAGRPPRDLVAGDVEIREDGALLSVVTLDSDGPTLRASSDEPSRFVIWFDQPSSSKATVRRAVDGFLPIVQRLTDLGRVELVMAADEPEEVLETRDELVLTERLRWAATNNPGEGRVLDIRFTTLQEALRLQRAAGSTPEEVAERVKSGIEEEIEFLRQRQDQLVAWIGSQPRRGPRVLFLVTDGFDLDPVAFYGEHLDVDAWRAVLGSTRDLFALEASVRQASRALAGLGWTLMPVAMEQAKAGPEVKPTLIEATDVEGTRTGGAGITLRPGSLFRRNRDKDKEEDTTTAPQARFLDSAGPLRLLADASGGEVVLSQRGLADAVARFSRRYEITYTSALPRDADLTAIEVSSRRGDLTVRAPRWLSRGVPESVAALRVTQLLRGRPDPGDLDVAAVLRLAELPNAPGQLEARLQLRDIYGEDYRPEDASFRVTVGTAIPGAPPRIERQVITGQDLTGLAEWRYQVSLDMPEEASEVAVLVEDLGLERWGGTRAGVVSANAAGDVIRPAPLVIAVERPKQEVLRGRVRFETRVLNDQVSRVLFQLDERDIAEVARRPFAARIDLGRSPRRQTLTVVAYDLRGEELGRDSVVLNAGSGGLEVEIIRPSTFKGTGEVSVEASVAVPALRSIDRVLFFWNSTPVATLFRPPYRQNFYIPPEKPVGYLRVVAMLDDGTVAEDVAFMNGPNAGERLDVNLVELYVVVTNEQGRPVRGLTQTDFRVREEGQMQEISSFSDASDLPLTLGMAIDSSASMFVKLPTIQRAAVRFLRSTFSEQDRAFVVDFDTQPRLVRSTTGRLASVERSIESLEANGRTALWESVVYSLVQLQGVRGRKALIVFSDGADEDDKFPFSSCLSFSKKMGVPIYMILMKREPKQNSGLSLFTRSFTSRVDRLVQTTGGRVFYAKEYKDLDEVYREIEIELRSQYLLTYYPKGNNRGAAWRDVDVDLLPNGLKPRTLSGYWQ